jgi:hypothetical protein
MQSAVKQSLERGLADTVIFEASTRPGDGYIHITGMCSVQCAACSVQLRLWVPNTSFPARLDPSRSHRYSSASLTQSHLSLPSLSLSLSDAIKSGRAIVTVCWLDVRSEPPLIKE